MRWLVVVAALLCAAAGAAYAVGGRGWFSGDDSTERIVFSEAERRRAVAYAADFARACRPPCSVHRVEPISPGLWRAHLNFENGYCVLIRLDEFRRTRTGGHRGWQQTNCLGRPQAGP